jgi:hypothetical protein
MSQGEGVRSRSPVTSATTFHSIPVLPLDAPRRCHTPPRSYTFSLSLSVLPLSHSPYSLLSPHSLNLFTLQNSVHALSTLPSHFPSPPSKNRRKSPRIPHPSTQPQVIISHGPSALLPILNHTYRLRIPAPPTALFTPASSVPGPASPVPHPRSRIPCPPLFILPVNRTPSISSADHPSSMLAANPHPHPLPRPRILTCISTANSHLLLWPRLLTVYLDHECPTSTPLLDHSLLVNLRFHRRIALTMPQLPSPIPFHSHLSRLLPHLQTSIARGFMFKNTDLPARSTPSIHHSSLFSYPNPSSPSPIYQFRYTSSPSTFKASPPS